MPRIPDASQLGYSVPRANTPHFQDNSALIQSEAVENFAGTVNRVASVLQEQDDQFNYSRAKSAILQADVDARRQLENDQDWETYEKRYTESMQKALDGASKMIRGKRSRALFDADARLDLDRGTGEIRNIAKRKEIDWGRGSLSSLLESNRTAALNAKDEATRAAIIAATQEAIGGALGKGYLSEQEAANHRQAWTSNYAEAYVGMQPAEERIKLLQGNKPGAITDYIAPDRRVDLLRQAENEVRIARDRAEAERKASMVELRQSLNDQLRDNMVAAQMGLPVNIPSKKVLQAAFGEAEGAARFDVATKAADLSANVATLNQLPTDQILAKVESYKPTQAEGAADQAQLFGYMATSAQKVLKARAADPAGYIVQNAPKSQQAWAAFQADGSDANRNAYISAVKADAERLGMPSDDLLPNSYAKALTDEIANPASAEKMADVIETERERWGEAWPQVHAQLAKDMPDMAAVIGSGVSRSAAVILASTAKLKESDLKSMLPPSVKWADVEDNVKSAFDDVRRSFPAEGARTYQAIEESAKRLAVSYMQAGDSRSGAVKRAYKELVTDNYGIGEVKDVTFLVPRQYDTEAIEDQAAYMLANFEPTPDMIEAPAGRDPAEFVERARKRFRNEAYWVANGAGDGLRLYMGARPTGVAYTFEQLSAMSTQRLAERAAREAELAALIEEMRRRDE